MAAAKQRQRVRVSNISLREAAETFLDGMRSRAIVTRRGRPYRYSVIRNYEQSLARCVLPDLGGRKLSDISTVDLQLLV